MVALPMNHDRGRIDRVSIDEVPALSRDVALDLPTIQSAWPDFESGFDALRGRKMMGLAYRDEGVYRLCSVRLDRDADNPLGLDETTIPGGSYLRLRLNGDVPAVYEQIAPAFDVLFELADHDPERPLIEYYRAQGQIDCLVPLR